MAEIQSRTYAWNNLGKIDSRNYTLYRGNASVSGCMDDIGQITAITVSHYHTGGTSNMTFTTACELIGNTVISGSDSVTKDKIGSSTPILMTNTLTRIPETVQEFEQWNSVRIWLVSQKPTGYRFYSYIGASNKSAYLTVYFYRKADLCPDANPPIIGTVTQSDSTMYSENKSIKEELGSYIGGYSKPLLTSEITLDFAKYDYITANANLTLASAGETVYSVDSKIDYESRILSASLPILSAGTYEYLITVTDASGNTVSRSGTFVVRKYTKPTASITVKRYGVTLNAEGTQSFVPDESGEYVRFWVNASADNINSLNTLTAYITYGDENAQTGALTIRNITGSSLSFSQSEQNYLNNKIFSASNRYWFTLTVADKLSETGDTEWIDVAGAIFDIEPYGVSVGMRSTATQHNKKFEVGREMPLIRYGLYDTNERVIGSFLRDGKELPVYEQTLIATNFQQIDSTHYLLGYFDVGSDLDLVLDYSYAMKSIAGVVNTSWYQDTSWNSFVSLESNARLVLFYRRPVSDYVSVVATVRYTKKSDL